MLLVSVTLLFFPSLVRSVEFICSDQNTGSSFSYVYNMYQSEGACGVTCATYAFAVLQASRCWCSNYFPASTVSNSDCNTPCPGYDSDICGGTLNGAFAYYQLAQASGTLSASSSDVSSTSSSSSSTSTSSTSTASPTLTTSSSTTTTSPGTTAAPVTVVITQTATPTSKLPSAGTSASSASTTASDKSTSSASEKSTSSASSTTTGSASLQTGSSTAALQAKKKTGFFSDAGKVAGTFVAVGIVAIALIAALIFLLRRRRRRQRNELMTAAALNRKTSSTSTIEEVSAFSEGRGRSESAAGLMSSGVREKTNSNSPTNNTWPLENSDILPIDQRLNPRPMLMRFDSNYSRHSLRDDEDYSRRVLQVANPETHR